MDPKPTTGEQSGGVNVSGGILTAEGDVVGRDKITQNINLRIEKITALHQLPSPPADFTGRGTELSELLDAVQKQNVAITGLQGLGGVGKTALALKLANELKANYPDGQFYVDLKGVSKEPLSPGEAMAHVIRGYNLTAKLPENEADLTALYRSVLDGKRALLLMDNAKDGKQVEPLIPPRSCLLLVTSRQRFTIPGLLERNLDELTQEDAISLLLRVAPRLSKEKPQIIADLTSLCSYLPLALRNVGSVLQEKKNLSAANYVHRLIDARERLKLTAVDASLTLSYELLPEELQRRFRALSVFPDTFHLSAAEAVWEAEQNNAEESLSELFLYNLADFYDVTDHYRLHDLVRLFADVHLPADEREVARLRHARHYRQVLWVANELYLQGADSVLTGLTLLDLEWANIQAGQVWARSHAATDPIAAQLCASYPNVGISCLELRLHPRERIRWLTAALLIASDLKDESLQATTLGNIGIAYHELSEHRRAVEYQKQSLELHRKIGENPVAALTNLGVALKNMGEFRLAIKYSEEALVAVGADDTREKGTILGNLGIAHARLGELDRAVAYFDQALAMDRKMGNRRSEARALGNLGNVHARLNDTQQAIKYYSEALIIHQEIGDRLSAETGLVNLGTAYLQLEQYDVSVRYYELALNLAREIGDRRGEAASLFNSSIILDKVGNRAEAILRAEAALKIFEQIEDAHAAIARDQLAEWRDQEKAKGPAAE